MLPFLDDVELIELEKNLTDVDKRNNSYYDIQVGNLAWNGGFEFVEYPMEPVTVSNEHLNAWIGPFWYSAGTGSANIIYNTVGLDSIIKPTRIQGYFSKKIQESSAFLGRGMGALIPYREKNDTAPEYFEHLTGTLKQPLEKDVWYNVSFMVKSAPFSKKALNRLGLMFSDTFPMISGSEQIQKQAAVSWEFEQEIGIEKGWVNVSGKYKAVGGEQYFLIGAIDEKPIAYFDNEIDIEYSTDEMPFSRLNHPYYFVDEVIVAKDSIPAKIGGNRQSDHLVFLIDASYSMSETGYLDKIRKSIIETAFYMDDNDTISIVSFGSKCQILANAVQAKNITQIESALYQISIKGKSPIERGLSLAAEIAEQHGPHTTNHLVVFTDGDYEIRGADKAFKKLSENAFRMYPILMGTTNASTNLFDEGLKITGGNMVPFDGHALDMVLRSIISGE